MLLSSAREIIVCLDGEGHSYRLSAMSKEFFDNMKLNTALSPTLFYDICKNKARLLGPQRNLGVDLNAINTAKSPTTL